MSSYTTDITHLLHNSTTGSWNVVCGGVGGSGSDGVSGSGIGGEITTTLMQQP